MYLDNFGKEKWSWA